MEKFFLETSKVIVEFIYIFGSFVFAMLVTPIMTHFLYKFKAWQQVKKTDVEGKRAPHYYRLHKEKHARNIPTMAGVLIWGVTLIVTLIFNFSRAQTWLPLFVLVSVGLLGLIDDYLNIRGVGKVKGIRMRSKLIWLTLFASVGAWWFYYKLGWSSIHIPALGDFEIGIWYLPLFVFFVISTANAVNITDGLDGLAGGLSIFAFMALGGIALFQANYGIAYFCGTLAGALLAYTWFNIYPARFFMGDTGSLALGATMAVVAMLLNSIVAFIIIGFVFYLEIFSSATQIISKKLFNKKIFISAPIHHHYEALGWPETKVTMRFWIIGAMMAVIGLIFGLLGAGI
jgi:phospho-N-acetylmuramoyl-pentapeptide-transferase